MLINPIPEIYISENIDNKLVQSIKDLGCHRIFIVTGPHISKTDGFIRLIQTLDSNGNTVDIFNKTTGDPSFSLVDVIVQQTKLFSPDIILGIGGGSPLDAAKIVAVLADKNIPAQNLTLKDVKITRDLPLLLIPTSAGTGSEVTPVSILTDTDNQIKTGILNKELIPEMAFLYGELTITMPDSVTAATGIDALCHSIEAYLSKKSNEFSRLMAKEAIVLIHNNLLISFNEPNNMKSRSHMLMASLYAGLAFSNSSVTAVHAFAYPLGGMFHITHGLANSLMLIPILKNNMLGNEDKYIELNTILGINNNPNGLIDYVRNLIDNLSLPKTLKDVGVTAESLEEMSQMVLGITRLLEVNPRKISADDALRIYKEAYYGE